MIRTPVGPSPDDLGAVQRLWIAIAHGLLDEVEAQNASPEEACLAFFIPAYLCISQTPGANASLIDALHAASQLDDAADIVPASLSESIERIRRGLREASRSLPPLGMRDWFTNEIRRRI